MTSDSVTSDPVPSGPETNGPETNGPAANGPAASDSVRRDPGTRDRPGRDRPSGDRARAGVMAGVMAMAATAGAVAALAWRAGDVTRPWVATGRAVLGATGSPATALVLGLGLHLAVAIGWGLLLAAVAHGARGLRLLTLAVAVSFLALLVHSSVLPAFRLGYGLGVFPLRGLPLLYLYALQSAAFALGMRLAR